MHLKGMILFSMSCQLIHLTVSSLNSSNVTNHNQLPILRISPPPNGNRENTPPAFNPEEVEEPPAEQQEATSSDLHLESLVIEPIAQPLPKRNKRGKKRKFIQVDQNVQIDQEAIRANRHSWGDILRQNEVPSKFPSLDILLKNPGKRRNIAQALLDDWQRSAQEKKIDPGDWDELEMPEPEVPEPEVPEPEVPGPFEAPNDETQEIRGLNRTSVSALRDSALRDATDTRNEASDMDLSDANLLPPPSFDHRPR